MMYAKESEFLKDFITRTQHNYNMVKQGPYEVTQLINSFVGFLIIPKEKIFDKISDGLIDQQLLAKMKQKIIIDTYPEHCSLMQIARHLRNAVAHGRMDFCAEKQPDHSKPPIIQSITFKDYGGYNKHNFEMALSIEEIEEFLLAFSAAASKLL